MNRIMPLRRFKSERHYALDFHDTKPSVWPSCSGPCDGGRKLCPSPVACQIGEREFSMPRAPFVAALIIVLTLAVWVLS